MIILLPGCQVTWRQPEIKPLDPVRHFAATSDAVCDALLTALRGAALLATTVDREQDACLVETDYRRLGEGDEGWQLRDVAYLSGGDFFSHGRFLVTATTRDAAQGTRVRLTTRIEGFDAGYRVLRSNGVIEDALFESLEAALGVPASGTLP